MSPSRRPQEPARSHPGSSSVHRTSNKRMKPPSPLASLLLRPTRCCRSGDREGDTGCGSEPRAVALPGVGGVGAAGGPQHPDPENATPGIGPCHLLPAVTLPRPRAPGEGFGLKVLFQASLGASGRWAQQAPRWHRCSAGTPAPLRGAHVAGCSLHWEHRVPPESPTPWLSPACSWQPS